MKVQLRAGAELDVLTPKELADELAKLPDQLRGLREPEPRWIRAAKSGQLDGSGNATIKVYQVPQGMEFRIGRVLLEVDGHDASSPFNGGGVQLLRDDVLESFQGGPLPALMTMPDGTQPRFRNATLVAVQVIAGPANSAVTATVQGTLHRGAP